MQTSIIVSKQEATLLLETYYANQLNIPRSDVTVHFNVDLSQLTLPDRKIAPSEKIPLIKFLRSAVEELSGKGKLYSLSVGKEVNYLGPQLRVGLGTAKTYVEKYFDW